jgi:23S rRNA pseudouridine2605 synthase
MPNNRNSKNSSSRRGREDSSGRNRSGKSFNKSDSRKGKAGDSENRSGPFGSASKRPRKFDSEKGKAGDSENRGRGKSFGGDFKKPRNKFDSEKGKTGDSENRRARSFGSDAKKPRVSRSSDSKERGGAGGREKRSFEKGPSFGLPFKRSYDKRERKSDSREGFASDRKRPPGKGTGESRFKKLSDKGGEEKGKSFGRKDQTEKRDNRGSSDKKFENRSRGKSFGRNDRTDKSSRRRDSDKDEAPFFKKAMDRYSQKSSEAESRKEEPGSAPAQTDKIRLNRYIANSGVCSRREADELITMGVISVNGKTVTELGYKVNPGDEVRYENKILKAEKPVYILMNKPKGYLTTTDDPQERNTVMHIVGGAVKERIYPVGRLDRNTTGLLLLTNDGDLADKLMHPSYDVKKIYKVELDRPLTKGDFQSITEGIRLEEGTAKVDDLAIISEDNKTVGVEIHIGWNRVVRRIFEALGYEVTRLDRSVYAGLDKKNLGRGEWRFLTKEEVVRLKHYK